MTHYLDSENDLTFKCVFSKHKHFCISLINSMLSVGKTIVAILLHLMYALNFVDDTFEKSSELNDEYYHYYKIVNINNSEKQIDGSKFLFVGLPNFKTQNRANIPIETIVAITCLMPEQTLKY